MDSQPDGNLNPDVPGDCLNRGLIHGPNRDSIHDPGLHDLTHGDLIRYGLIHPVHCEAFAAVCGLFSCSY
jgi:hypothetical protein